MSAGGKGRATLILGRHLGDEADKADFEAWVDYVSEHIDEKSGCDVTVEVTNPRDVQDDKVRVIDFTRADGYSTEDAVNEALRSLWDDFCADTSAWPGRPAP